MMLKLNISNHFNDYFTNVVSELVKKLPITSYNHKTYLPSATFSNNQVVCGNIYRSPGNNNKSFLQFTII